MTGVQNTRATCSITLTKNEGERFHRQTTEKCISRSVAEHAVCSAQEADATRVQARTVTYFSGPVLASHLVNLQSFAGKDGKFSADEFKAAQNGLQDVKSEYAGDPKASLAGVVKQFTSPAQMDQLLSTLRSSPSVQVKTPHWQDVSALVVMDHGPRGLSMRMEHVHTELINGRAVPVPLASDQAFLWGICSMLK